MRKNVMAWLRTLGILLLAVLVLIPLFLGYTITRSFPNTTGTVKIAGLHSTVRILRDANGIPQIYADNVHDLFLAQGYVHAQDRFYQMDFWRHTTAGRLSELYGESQLDTDRFLRTVGWHRVAEEEYKNVNADTKVALDAYAEGVNAYIGTRAPEDLSLEYALLGVIGLKNYKPDPWTPADSLAWGKSMAWDLGGNFTDEILYARLLQDVGLQKATELFPQMPDDHPVIVPNPAIGALQLDGLQAQAAAVNQLLGGGMEGLGSNDWVIAGSRTTTGKPLLADDPHLSIQMPAIWYLVGLHCQPLNAACPFDVQGYSLAGDPGIIIGHNNHIAWGVTNTNPDVQDLYIEKINPANPNQYEVDGAWVDAQIINETIKLRDGSTKEISIRVTRHGPIISEVFGRATRLISESVTISGTQLTKDQYALALRWTALEPGHVFESVIKLNKAQNWDDFRNALRDWTAPAQNFVYADVEGNIGYQMPSNVPIRNSGDGTLPVPGWTDEYEWTGYIPFDELPYSFNPPQGYIATANQNVAGPDYKYLITKTGFDSGYRAERINEMLQSQDKISPEYIMQIHGDNAHLGAREIMPYLLALTFDDPKQQQALDALRSWDMQMHMDSQPAAIFASFYRTLIKNVINAQVPSYALTGGGGTAWLMLRNILNQPDSEWWQASGGRDAALKTAFQDGYKELATTYGANAKWGALHTATFRNQTLGSSASPSFVQAMFNRGPFPVSGGASIVNATGYNINNVNPYEVTALPSMRMIVDFSNLDQMYVIHTTGQSGHAYHPHYIDFADKWRNIQYVLMPFSPSAVEQVGIDVLTLTP